MTYFSQSFKRGLMFSVFFAPLLSAPHVYAMEDNNEDVRRMQLYLHAPTEVAVQEDERPQIGQIHPDLANNEDQLEAGRRAVDYWYLQAAVQQGHADAINALGILYGIRTPAQPD